MGFGKFSDDKKGSTHFKIELYDFDSGDAVYVDGKRQFLTVKGAKSRAFINGQEQAIAQENKRKDSAYSHDRNIGVLARRMANLVVSGLIDIGDDEPDIIEFEGIDELSQEDRNAIRTRLKNAFVDVTDLLVLVQEEVVKDANFLPKQEKPLSEPSSNEGGTTQLQMEASSPA